MATSQLPNLKDLMAVTGTGQLKALGFLTWFSVPDEAVGLRRLKKTLSVHGLPPSLAPDNQKAINTFKRAMREQEGRHRDDSGRVRENVVGVVVETPRDCVYQVSTTLRDTDEQLIEYPKALRVIFNKETEEIRFNPLGGVKRSEVLEVMDAIEAFYEANATKVTGAKVRGIVRNYLKSQPDEERNVEGLSGENLRGRAGGIYFIPAKYQGELEALAAFLEELYPASRAYLHMVPLADTESEREIIRRHHIANAKEELEEAIGDVRELLRADRDRSTRSNVIAHHMAKYHATIRRSAEYAGILEDESEEIAEQRKILKKQLDKLAG